MEGVTLHRVTCPPAPNIGGVSPTTGGREFGILHHTPRAFNGGCVALNRKHGLISATTSSRHEDREPHDVALAEHRGFDATRTFLGC